MNQTRNRPETAPIKRGEFLRSLGLSGAALMAVYCMGTTLTSCSNSSDDPTPNPGPGPGTGTKVDFTLDLTATANADLQGTKAYLIKDNVIVARTGASSYVALSKICTHQGTTVEYEAALNRIHCPNHGSNFNTNGSVINGPAASPLKTYSTTLTGTTLRVFEV